MLPPTYNRVFWGRRSAPWSASTRVGARKSLICVFGLAVLVPGRGSSLAHFCQASVAPLLYCRLEFHISLLLNCLGVLQFLNQLHFQNLHLHNLLLLECNYPLLLLDLLLYHHTRLLNFPFSQLFHFQFRDLLLSLNLLLLHLVLLRDVLHVLL